MTRTLAELEAVQNQVYADDALLQSQGIVTQTVGVDIPANVVRVDIAELTDAKRTFLQQRYGSAVRVAEEVVESAAGKGRAAYWNPIIAGLRIVGPKTCTNGFTAVAGFVVNGAVVEYNVTFSAGHCGEVNSVWFQGGGDLGIVWRQRFEEDSKVDGLIIRTPRRRRSEVFITRRTTQFSVGSSTPIATASAMTSVTLAQRADHGAASW